jgi:hypothetical protein
MFTSTAHEEKGGIESSYKEEREESGALSRFRPGVVVHVRNASYRGGGNQEDCGLRQAQAKNS